MAASVTWPEPSPGDFAVVSAGGAVGPLISFGELLNGSGFTQWDHALIYTGKVNGGIQIVEADPGGARTRELADFHLGRADVLWSTGKVTLTLEERTAIVDAALHYAAIKVPYSGLDYLAIAAHHLHLWAPGLKDYVGDTGHMICSQLVDQCYNDAGVQLFSDKRWPGYVTPADLGALIESCPLEALPRLGAP